MGLLRHDACPAASAASHPTKSTSLLVEESATATVSRRLGAPFSTAATPAAGSPPPPAATNPAASSQLAASSNASVRPLRHVPCRLPTIPRGLDCPDGLLAEPQP